MEPLEAMRGVAAFWVVLHHAHLSVTAFLDPSIHAPLAANGFLGVDFFFILSGFIIAYSSNRMLDDGRGLQAYFQSRILRVYVPYLPIGVGILILYWLLPGLSESNRAPGLLTSLTLLPSESPPALSVAWTLVHELIFYAIFATIFVSKRLLYSLLGIWAVAIVATAYLGTPLSRMESYLLSPLNLCFHLGVAVFHARKVAAPTSTVVLVAAIGVVTVTSAACFESPNRVVVATGFSLLVWAASSMNFGGIKVWKFASILGAASYSVYLIHNPAVSIAARALQLLAPAVNVWIALVVITAVSVAAGLVYWACFERPVLRKVRALLVQATPDHRRRSDRAVAQS